MRWLLVVVLLAGCAQPPVGISGCGAPEGADASRAPYDNGVVLYTQIVQDGPVHRVTGWACNEDTQTRYLLHRAGECQGSWSWTLTPPGPNPGSGPDGHYGSCDFVRLPPGTHAVETMEVTDAPPGAEWRIRLQVYTQAQMIEDAGGGPVHAVYRI